MTDQPTSQYGDSAANSGELAGVRPRQVLVIRAGAIGDFILTLPALAALRKAYPAAEISLVGNVRAAVLALASGYVDAVEAIDAPWVASLFGSDGASEEVAARLTEVDLAVVWLRDPSDVAGSLRALGVPTLAAPSFPPGGSRHHVADHLLATLAPLLSAEPPAGPARAEARPQVVPSEADRALAAAFWSRHGLGDRPVVGLHPGSGGPRKNWPPERFAAVADRLASSARVLLVAGPADEAPAAAFRRSVRRSDVVEAAVDGLGGLAAILARCDAYLGNDSGVSHLAAAVGTPTVALFGPTDPATWAPLGPRVTVLWRGLDCSPCAREAALACPDRRCLGLITVDEVAAAVAALL